MVPEPKMYYLNSTKHAETTLMVIFNKLHALMYFGRIIYGYTAYSILTLPHA